MQQAFTVLLCADDRACSRDDASAPRDPVVVARLQRACGSPLDKASKESFEFAGLKRSYSLFAPLGDCRVAARRCSCCCTARTATALRSSAGGSSLAEQEGIVLAGPDAREREAWQLRADGPQFIRALIDNVAAKHSIDRSRIYLFGSSGGAVYSLTLSMLESQLFAATAVHAGAWRAPNEFRAVPYARRKIPIAIFIGDKDEYFPLFAVRKTQKALEQAGHPRERHGHPRSQSRIRAGRCRSEPQRLGIHEGQSTMNKMYSTACRGVAGGRAAATRARGRRRSVEADRGVHARAGRRTTPRVLRSRRRAAAPPQKS